MACPFALAFNVKVVPLHAATSEPALTVRFPTFTVMLVDEIQPKLFLYVMVYLPDLDGCILFKFQKELPSGVLS